MSITVRPRGDGFQVQVRIKRHGVIVHSESSTHATEALARDWGKRVQARVKAQGVEQRRIEIHTLAQLIERYRDELAKVVVLRHTREAELQQLAGSRIGKLRLHQVTSAELVKWAGERRQEGAGPTTILHNLSTLRAIFGAAKPMFDIDVGNEQVRHAIDVLARIGAVARSKWRDRRLNIETNEEARLMEEFERVSTHPSTFIPMAQVMQLAIHFPRRREELCGKLLWSGLDARRKTARLIDTKHPSSPRTEVVPVPPKAWAIIQSLPRIDERVLPYEVASVSKAFERACARLGIKDLRFHDLRHEGISRLFEAGLNIEEVSSISGHLSWNTLRRYTHLRPERVLDKLNAGTQEKPQAGTESS